MHRRLTGLAGGYVLVELGLHLSFEFTGRYGGVWWPFILAHQAPPSHAYYKLYAPVYRVLISTQTCARIVVR